MANRTVKDAVTIKGTNPQYIIEKITRTRIYESKFWKEECFALTAELMVDKAMDLKLVTSVSIFSRFYLLLFKPKLPNEAAHIPITFRKQCFKSKKL